MKYIYAFRGDGICVEKGGVYPVPPIEAFRANHGADVVLAVYDEAPHPDVPASFLTAAIEGGELTAITRDPDWVPPEPAPTLEDHLAEIKEMVRNNLLASEHDRRWLGQKEAAKREGIPWLKAHPTASLAEFEAAMTSALASEFPGEPIVISPSGVIASYARGAQAKDLVAAPTYEDLRDLVVATPDKQIQKMLAKL